MEIDPAQYDNHIEGGLYDDVVRQLMALPKGMSLGDTTYKDDFICESNINTGNFAYKCRDNGAEYETVLVGEILPRPCGTKFNVIGNHYLGTRESYRYGKLTLTCLTLPNIIDDRTRVKGVFALGKPTQATEMMYITFGNQIATLDDIIQSDMEELKRQNKDVNVKEWTVHAGTDQTGMPEYIPVNTEQLYVVPKGTQQTIQGKRARVAKKTINDMSELGEGKAAKKDSVAGGSRDNTQETEITTNTFYDPTVLPDYGGDLFQHINAKLHQLDIRNVENEFIPPQDWYTSLKHGTLVMIRATLHTFNWKEHRVYQLNGHTIRVLDASKLEIEPLSSQLNGFDTGGSPLTSNSRVSDAMANVQLGKRGRQE
ncbi:uncharacterized protein F5891DRAFT_961758 [Suillus fuscotomentosus]|uniref:Uncharacterized protein n=1 Tax=Suillus fuscotomentosus TaxID=1912939 RepID=A0AAD4HG62_9AGAM|nr:uncharacterized protein F5891DRAFT_961758 [Suillus fuscotomentosus]KAG1894299.1 hypothetical protein F5891DRAFT_961758 [Suillus fuscotomentosus]